MWSWLDLVALTSFSRWACNLKCWIWGASVFSQNKLLVIFIRMLSSCGFKILLEFSWRVIISRKRTGWWLERFCPELSFMVTNLYEPLIFYCILISADTLTIYDSLVFLHQNLSCEFSQELPLSGNSNEYHKVWLNAKINRRECPIPKYLQNVSFILILVK